MSKDSTSYIPVSKKNNPSWNYITQTTAKTVAGKMYEGSSSVTSSLIDSYAWDTVTQWISNSGIDVTDSTSWGNHHDASFEINGLYAKHEWRDDGSGWLPAYTWSKGIYTKAADTRTKTRTETATGSVERNKAKNIYDFAGNMYEWTTENNIDITSSKTFAVIRGGGFVANHPVSYRHRDDSTSYITVDIGFRIVLYIK